MKNLKNEIIKYFCIKNDVDINKIDDDIKNRLDVTILEYIKTNKLNNKHLNIFLYHKDIIKDKIKNDENIKNYDEIIKKCDDKEKKAFIKNLKKLYIDTLKNEFYYQNNFNNISNIFKNIEISFCNVLDIPKNLDEFYKKCEREYIEQLHNNECYIVASKVLIKSLYTLLYKGNIASYKILYNKNSGVYDELRNEIIVKMLEKNITYDDFVQFSDIQKELKDYFKKELVFQNIVKQFKENKISKSDFEKIKKTNKNIYLQNIKQYDFYYNFLDLYKVVQNYLYNIKNDVLNVNIVNNNDDEKENQPCTIDFNKLSYTIENELLQVAEDDTKYEKQKQLNILKNLTKFQKQVLEMHYIGKMQYKDIAKKLNKSVNQVTNVIYRLKNRKKVNKI